MLVRRFNGFGSAARFLEKQAATVIPVTELAAGATAELLHRSITSRFGDNVLPPLTQMTQDERVALGYTPNDPLLRDGSLLRDSVEQEVGPGWAGVGSSEPVMAYSEFGAWNHWANKLTPPRPVFLLGLQMAAAGIMRILEALAQSALGFGSLTTVSRTAAQSMAAQPSLPGLAAPIAGYNLEVT